MTLSGRPRSPFGARLKARRSRAGASQLRLAVEAGVSPRHLSFIESGRSTPSREMVLRLARHLRVPLREQNEWLRAAGFAPAFPDHALDTPELGAVRAAAALVLESHEPYPAMAIDRKRNVVMGNRAGVRLVRDAAIELREPTLNVYRVLLHPRGLAPRILDFEAYSSHLLARLERDAEAADDDELRALLAEVERYPNVGTARQAGTASPHAALTLRVREDGGELAFLTTLATFGTPFEVTVSELIIESLFPVDARTRERMHELARETTPAE